MIFRQPVSVEAFRDGVELDTAVIYFQAGLAYLLSSGDGKISGKSRLTLKEDFLIRLRVYERIIEAAIRKVLTIVIKYLSERYPILNGYKSVVELNLAVSPLPEEREQNREDLKVGGMSLTSFIGANSMDVGKEMKLIERDLGLLEKVNRVFKIQRVKPMRLSGWKIRLGSRPRVIVQPNNSSIFWFPTATINRLLRI